MNENISQFWLDIIEILNSFKLNDSVFLFSRLPRCQIIDIWRETLICYWSAELMHFLCNVLFILKAKGQGFMQLFGNNSHVKISKSLFNFIITKMWSRFECANRMRTFTSHIRVFQQTRNKKFPQIFQKTFRLFFFVDLSKPFILKYLFQFTQYNLITQYQSKAFYPRVYKTLTWSANTWSNRQ